MKNLNLLFLLSLIGTTTLLTGCASFTGAESHENVQNLKRGMSQNQVLSLLGTPDSVVHESESADRWIYEFKNSEKKGHNLFVDFQEGSVSKSGELSGRDIAAAEENRTPGTCTKWQRPEFVENSLCTK